MQAKKLDGKYKCGCYGLRSCNCPYKHAENKVLLKNVEDISETVHEVMKICGIDGFKARSAIGPISRAFLDFREELYRIDAVPRKHLRKGSLFNALGRKCKLGRMDSQLTYTIVKRAFKAFYYGTGKGGIRDPSIAEQLVHSPQCLWVHAAKRTAQIYAAYEGMFYSIRKKYEAVIMSLYKKLYDRLQSRVEPLVTEECTCRGCVKRIIVQAPKLTRNVFSMNLAETGSTTSDDSNASEDSGLAVAADKVCRRTSNPDVIPACMTANTAMGSSQKTQRKECKCPRLDTMPSVTEIPQHRDTDCSQGPYKCVWIRVGDALLETIDESVIRGEEPPSDIECPVCVTDSCDSECTCECDVCECECEYELESDFDGDSENKGEEEDIIPFQTCDPTDLSNNHREPCSDD